jgi:histidine triad (HIT) family protein
MSDCVFCKIAKGEISTKLEWEDDKIVKSLKDSKKQDIDLLGNIQRVAKELAKKKGIESAFRLLTISGKKAGQTVFHLHYHLIGGWKDKAPEIEAIQ